MMGISLPNFTAYTELYRGRVVGCESSQSVVSSVSKSSLNTIRSPFAVPPKHRPLIALLCLSPSMGILFGGWISAEVAHWPIAFNSAVLTFAVALGYAGVALFWSDHLRSKAELYDYLLHKEEEEGIRRKGIALEKEKVAREKGMDILSPDMTRVPTQESAYATPAITPVIMKEGISPV